MTKTLFKTFLQDEQGQDLVEYALLLAFISLAAITTLSGLKSSIQGVFNTVSTNLAAANSTAGK